MQANKELGLRQLILMSDCSVYFIFDGHKLEKAMRVESAPTNNPFMLAEWIAAGHDIACTLVLPVKLPYRTDYVPIYPHAWN